VCHITELKIIVNKELSVKGNVVVWGLLKDYPLKNYGACFVGGQTIK